MTKGILFIVDCLRSDVFPSWFRNKYNGIFFPMFFTAMNTPLSLSSIFLGRHLLADKEIIPYPNCANYHWEKPEGITIFEILKEKGIQTYFYTDERSVRESWWKDYTHMINNLKILSDNYFLVYHTYKAHSPHGRFRLNFVGYYKERKESKEVYLQEVERVFRNIDRIIQDLQPDKFIVMGDHGEEFFVEEFEGDPLKRETGHGRYKHGWIFTKNVLFTCLFIVDGIGKEKDGIVSYEYLFDRILKWYQ
jgi:hypothetical protein